MESAVELGKDSESIDGSSMRIYKNDRPLLTVERTGGRNLGRCYNATNYRVTSRHPLSMESFKHLRAAGMIGYGQEFNVHQVTISGKRTDVPDTLDWMSIKNVEPSGKDTVDCVEVDERTNEVTCRPSINPYSGKEDVPIEESYYVYECEDRVDSSD